MSDKEKTPLMISIERKKEKVIELRKMRDSSIIGSKTYKLYVEKILFILEEIKEDEKLLPVEKNSLKKLQK